MLVVLSDIDPGDAQPTNEAPVADIGSVARMVVTAQRALFVEILE